MSQNTDGRLVKKQCQIIADRCGVAPNLGDSGIYADLNPDRVSAMRYISQVQNSARQPH